MTDPNPEDSQKDKKEPPTTQLPFIEPSDAIVEDCKKTGASNQRGDCPKYEHPPIVIKNENRDNPEIAREANAIARKANKISWVSTFVNSVLMIATICIFIKTCQSVSVSKEAAKAAEDAVTQYRRANDLAKSKMASDSEDSKKRFNNDTSATNKGFREQEKGLGLQRAEIGSAQKQFEFANRPFIFVNPKISLDTSIQGIIKINFKVDNFGKLPGKILLRYAKAGSGTYAFYNDIKKFVDGLPLDSGVASDVILGPGASLEEINTINATSPQLAKVFPYIWRGETNIYLYGFVMYINVATGKNYLTKFIYKVTINPMSSLVMSQSDSQL